MAIISGRLRRVNRLAAERDFNRVRNEGRSWPHPLLVLYARRGEPRPPRFGVVVSKRTGSAVVRNRVKRRLREIMRPRLARLGPGSDLVFVARPRAAVATFADLSAAVAQLLRRSGLEPA